MLSESHATFIKGWFALYVTTDDTYIAAKKCEHPNRYACLILKPENKKGERELIQFPIFPDAESAGKAALRTFLELP